ncbi:TPA: hypothetical protein ACW45H_004791 [Salmonella enterica subsp. enterica serovar Newport]|nr:hypothetical protein [Salmonella enterica subsp. enterica serovar 4,[5],12:b:-]
MSRGAPQRRGAVRETALRLTARQLHRRGAMSAGDGATGRRIRLRMLQAGFYASDRSVSPKPRRGFGGAWQVRQQLPRRSRARRPDAARQSGAEGARESGDLMTESLHYPVRTSDITAHHPVTGKPGLQRRRRCFPLFRQAPACQGFFARADRRHPCCP